MITELSIKDFAIIDDLRLKFEPGFVVFTGETGAGKSIIIDAVELLMGGRAEAAMVRSGAGAALVEGVFTLVDAIHADVRVILEREDLPDEDDSLTLSREVRREGRSLCRINGRAASLSLLKEIGQYLVDIHGQSEHLSLLRVKEHIFLLDRFAGADGLRTEFARQVASLNQIRKDLRELREGMAEAERRKDLLNFQINEITAAALKPGEEEKLLEERLRLANAEKLAALTQEAVIALYEGSDDQRSASDMLGQAAHALAALARVDPSQAALHERAQSLSELAAELARDAQAYHEAIEFNPGRLDEVEERLDLIKRLKRKYGDTIEAVLDFAEVARTDLESVTHAGERIQELQAQERALLDEIGGLGQKLSKARKSAASKLSQSIEAELADLRMGGAKFAADIQWSDDPQGAFASEGRRVAFDSTGLDRVEFLVAPNMGEGLKPLVKIASGGETSRLMLALKSVLARADRTPSLIFDEIDQGIGGRAGAIVGRKLWGLADSHQVMCITHLPQLAGYGDQHFKVEKELDGQRTVTRVKALTGRQQVLELAQMLGAVTGTTRESAEEILDRVRKEKGKSPEIRS